MKCLFRCIKKSKNNYIGPVHISVILNVDLAQKSLYLKPVDNNIRSEKTIRKHNWKAAPCA